MMQDLINYIDHVFEFLIWRRPTKRPHNLIHFQTSYNYQYIRLSRVREAPQLHMKPTYKAFLIIVTKFSFTLKSFVTCPSSSSPIEPPPSLNPIKTQCCCQHGYFVVFNIFGVTTSITIMVLKSHLSKKEKISRYSSSNSNGRLSASFLENQLFYPKSSERKILFTHFPSDGLLIKILVRHLLKICVNL